jgi:hypothetical protein
MVVIPPLFFRPPAARISDRAQVCVDAGCCTGGWLTALDVASGEIWQVDEMGQPRS